MRRLRLRSVNHPSLHVKWVEGDLPALQWDVLDVALGTRMSLVGATATINWFNANEQLAKVTVDSETVTISDDIMSWTPAATDLPCDLGYNGKHRYHGQIIIVFSGGEKRTLPADRSEMTAVVHERNE